MSDALFVASGVTTAAEARLDSAALLAVQGPTALDVRTGVMAAPGTTALVSGTSSTSPMRYSIAPHHWVTTRGSSNGPYIGTCETTQLVDTTAAPPSGQSRIDVIWVKQQDTSAGIPGGADPTTAPQYGCTQGTPTTGTPTKPSIPVGAEELATATVTAGTTATSSLAITQTARQTTARGGIIPARSTDTDNGAHPQQYRDMPGVGLQKWTGTAWQTVADAGAVPLTALSINGLPTSFSADATSPPGIRKLGSGLIVGEGKIALANLAFGLGQTICTFPAGSRPGTPQSFLLSGFGAGAWRADLATNGVLSYGAGVANTAAPSTLSLAGLQFYAVN